MSRLLEVQDRGDRRGEGERGDHENTLPLGGRLLGQVWLYGERGRRGGTKRDGHHKNPQGTKSNERIVWRKRGLGTQRLGGSGHCPKVERGRSAELF